MARCGVKQWHGMLRCQQKCLAREEDLEDSMEEEETNGKGKVMKYISSVIKQVELHKQDKFFMKRLLHLITFGYFYYKKDMMKTIKATSMIEQLLSILRELDEGQDQLQVMITSVLYLVGSIDKVREIMRQSKRKDHKIGGSFIFWGEKKDEDEEMSEQNLEITHIDEDQLMSCSVDMDEQILERDEDLIQKDKIQENEKLSSDDSQNFINFDDLMNQMKQQENILPIISQEDKLKQSELVLQTKIPQRVFEKNIFRVCCQFSELKNTRRFGFIAEDSEVLNNIPVANKDFRAVTYDDKDGTIRLGWHEIFKWNPTIKTNQQQWFTFEVDLREDIPYNTIRLFIESEEAPIIFVNIPKKVKIYFASETEIDMKQELQLFRIPQPAFVRNENYSKVIDYNMTLQQQEDEQSKLITTDDKTKLRQIVSPEVIISSDVIKYEPDGVVSRIVSVQHTIQPGGIAILSASQDIPNKVNYSEMINLKGVIFTLPEFALYMNGIQIWKKNQFENSSIETSSSSSSSSKQHQHPKWTSLCLQLDMESEERVAKFFIGAHFEEEVDVNICNIPKDLKVVILSSGAVKAYQALDVKRVGRSDKTQILWEI